ncbi:hypothetical protein VJI72_08240, partial [Parvimonas micra]|uniref:hypothetical protein n=1 Tax=Parvimonas micra TaxID=33033 RepID=UPI002B4A44CA
WARNRFGRDRVYQIGTYNKYGAKAALTGVLKTNDQFRSKYADKTHIMAQYISKMIPFNESNLDEAVKASPELEQYSNKFSDQFEVAKKMIG